MIRRQVRFTGRVQGVGFRATTHTIARNYAVTGWVRNESDGSVLLEVQGADPTINDFLSQLRQALGRYIRSSTDSAIEPVADESAFAIRR